MGAGSDKEPLASPGNFFPGRNRRVAEPFAELFGRSFLAFSHFAAVDHHIVRVVLSLDLDLTKFHQSCFHISMFCWLPGASRPETRILRIASSANRRFEFDKRGEPFIGSHNEALPVVA